MKHLILQYLNKPWEAGARGPDAFDCYGLVYDFYKRVLNIALPHYPILPSDIRSVSEAVEEEAKQWIQVEELQKFDVVCLGKKTLVHHIALFLGGGKVIHVGSQFRSKVTEVSELYKEYKTVKFYRHASYSQQ